MRSHKKRIPSYYFFIIKKTGLQALSFLTFSAYLIVCMCFVIACKSNEQDLTKLAPYKGPLMESENIERLYSDQAVIRVRMTAPKEEQMESGDMLYKKGVYMEFFDESQVRTSTLKANKGTYSKVNQLYTVTGNVVIIDSVKSQTMNTEELHWDPVKHLIYTDKFVTIQTKKEVLTGQGLEAKEDFSSWRILKPKGILPINEQ